MISRSRLPFIFVMALTVAGCGGVVPLHEVDGTRVFDRELSKEQVKEAIVEGAEKAGWRAKDLGNDKILATYIVRVHTVHVNILYTDSYYSINYNSSIGMKMFCTRNDKEKARNLKVSGRATCPGGRGPLYIHGSYKIWVDSLNNAIHFELAAM